MNHEENNILSHLKCLFFFLMGGDPGGLEGKNERFSVAMGVLGILCLSHVFYWMSAGLPGKNYRLNLLY